MTFLTNFIANLIPPLVLVGMGALAALVVVFVLTFTNARSAISPIHAWVRSNAALLGFTVALTATLGSLFYSEVMGFVPCRYCWYQRILMYPQVLLFGVALLARTRDVFKYALALSIPGFGIAAYHYVTQVFQLTTNCVAPGGAEVEAASCSMRYVFDYGFMSIPFQAGIAFLLIAVVSLLALRRLDASRRDR